MSTIIQMKYYVQGLYVDRTNPKNASINPPITWTRTWQLWRECDTLEDAMQYYRSGKKLKLTKDYSSFTDLRVVEVEQKLTVLEIK